MTFTVRIPPDREPERRYAVETFLGEIAGLDCEIVVEPRAGTRISLRGSDLALDLPDSFFAISEGRWLARESVPTAVAASYVPAHDGLAAPLVSPELPVLFDARAGESQFAGFDARGGVLRIDPLGTAFFLLSRYQEVAAPEFDAHGRYPIETDLAFRSGFHDRPIVDEYAEVVWVAVQRVWPGATRREPRFQLTATHDVDLPFQHKFTGPLRLLRSCAADWMLRRDALGPFRRVAQWSRTKRGDAHSDPANTFDLIMDLSERAGLVSEFNFITLHSVPHYDALYPLRHPWIAALARRMHERGHVVGLHASYGSYLDAAQTKREFDELRDFCRELGIEQSRWGGRQHWLRCRMPDTLQNWDDAGLDFDSTLGYEKRIGFRSGSCRPHRVFNLRTRRTLRLRERPLVAMDASLTDSGTMNLAGSAAADAMSRLVQRCRTVRGECVVLWHNSRLMTPADVDLYRGVLAS